MKKRAFEKSADPMEGQNPDRCRARLKLVQDVGSKWETMHWIVKKYK
ncbi:hypothetical protein [Novisyntrophococcus fermenticellae]|nr:hypothetical protein [Novisyntrophococcus fermenticellae]